MPAGQRPVFSITPDKMLLASKETTTFMISGLSDKAGMLRTPWQHAALNGSMFHHEACTKQTGCVANPLTQHVATTQVSSLSSWSAKLSMRVGMLLLVVPRPSLCLTLP